MKLPPGLTLQAACDQAASAFGAACLPDARPDAIALLLHAAGISRTSLITEPHRLLTPQQTQVFEESIARRLAREPVTRITGRRGFWDIELQVAPGVLDPRADTEVLIEAALQVIGPGDGDGLVFLDLGCGSGAIVCALLDVYRKADAAAVDISAAACALTRENARHCGVDERLTVLQCNWSDTPPGRHDLIVSNPPYIRSGDMAALDPEVTLHDPLTALDGGADGLAAYRELVLLAPRLLTPGGWLVWEIGYDQAAEVAALLRDNGWTSIRTFSDLGGHTRAIAAQHGSSGKEAGSIP